MKTIKKNITFVYMDAAESEIYRPIADEARKRGYKVIMTDNKFAKCEIGFYCQHVNFPQYSKISVIMLHDIIQQYVMWPDIWIREPWNKYDIGFLPSNQWVNNWNQCSKYYYANPKHGMYKVGWPKADCYANLNKKDFVEKFNKIHGLDSHKKTVLYAPSWENDGKQDDFVQSMLKLDVNILIKQAAVNPKDYPEMYVEIQRMSQLHKDIERVCILDPTTNIFEAIMASDILVSEESSTMCEAIMMGVPAISVSDWLIPDTVPKRYPKCNYDFVYMTKKVELSGFVSSVLEHYDNTLKQVEDFRENCIGGVGGAASMIMDIVDDYISGRNIRYDNLKPEPRKRVPLKRYIFHIIECTKRKIYYNYSQKSRLIAVLWDMLSTMKRFIIHR